MTTTATQQGRHQAWGIRARRTPGARQRARGSVAISVAIVFGTLIVLFIGIELGYLFYQKRELQKAVDLAALAGAQVVQPDNCTGATEAARTNAQSNLPAYATPETLAIVCGHWDEEHPDPEGKRFTATTPYNAVQIGLSATPPLVLSWLPGNAARTVGVEAIAARQTPQATLNIRSTLLAIDADKAGLLNQVVGALLGGSVDLSAASWNGLLGASVNLLDFLVALDATAGDYEEVLNAPIAVAQLLGVTAELLERNGMLADAQVELASLIAAAEIRDADVRLADLISVVSGTPFSALDVDLQAFSLIQGLVQLANGEHAVASDLALNVPGLAGVTAQIKVIEPPQMSAIGNPARINPALGDSDPNRIYVRTAQVRALVGLELGGLTGVVSNLASAVTGALSPLLNFLNSVVNGNLPELVTGLLGGVICGPCPPSDVLYVEALDNPKFDISIEGGAGSARVTDHECGADTKSLDVHADTTAARVRIGRIENAFSSAAATTVEPVSLVEIGSYKKRYGFCLLGLLGSILCSDEQYKSTSGEWEPVPLSTQVPEDAARQVLAGIGLKLDLPIAGSATATPMAYQAPPPDNLPEIDAPPYPDPESDPSYQAMTTSSIVAGLGAALGNLEIDVYESDQDHVLGVVLQGTISLINGLLDTVGDIVGNALGTQLLDPILNPLLPLLGIDLAQAEVGARLSCERGASLVY